MTAYLIGNKDAIRWFATAEDWDRALQELQMAKQRQQTIDVQPPHAALAAELEERARMWGMGP